MSLLNLQSGSDGEPCRAVEPFEAGSVKERDEADRVRSVLAETTLVTDTVVALLMDRNPSTHVERAIIAELIWQMRVRAPGLRDSDVVIEQFDHVSSPASGFRGSRHREGPGGSPDERAAWIVDEIYSRPASHRSKTDR